MKRWLVIGWCRLKQSVTGWLLISHHYVPPAPGHTLSSHQVYLLAGMVYRLVKSKCKFRWGDSTNWATGIWPQYSAGPLWVNHAVCGGISSSESLLHHSTFFHLGMTHAQFFPCFCMSISVYLVISFLSNTKLINSTEKSPQCSSNLT